MVSINATDPDAAEAGPDPGTFRIARTGSTVGSLTVNYTIATGVGRATGVDYTPSLSGVATISSGQSFVDLTVTPVDDALFEGSEALTLTLFDSGSYDIGSAATATVTIVDNDPPDTGIDSAPGTPTGSNSAHFVFSGSEPVSAIGKFECSLDGAVFATCTSPVDYNGLTDSVHTFAVRAVDFAGNANLTPASFAWVVDTTTPTIAGSRLPAPNAAGWNHTPVVVTFQCADTLSGLAVGSPPLPVTLAFEGASQSVTRSCSDVVGNTASASVDGINIDFSGPAITVSASSPVLWPPNGKVVRVTISGRVVDALSGVNPRTAKFRVIDGHEENEFDRRHSHEHDEPNGSIVLGNDGRFSFAVALEAERRGEDRDGRRYTVIVSARDRSGNRASSSTMIVVPHDRRR